MESQMTTAQLETAWRGKGKGVRRAAWNKRNSILQICMIDSSCPAARFGKGHWFREQERGRADLLGFIVNSPSRKWTDPARRVRKLNDISGNWKTFCPPARPAILSPLLVLLNQELERLKGAARSSFSTRTQGQGLVKGRNGERFWDKRLTAATWLQK